MWQRRTFCTNINTNIIKRLIKFKNIKRYTFLKFFWVNSTSSGTATICLTLMSTYLFAIYKIRTFFSNDFSWNAETYTFFKYITYHYYHDFVTIEDRPKYLWIRTVLLKMYAFHKMMTFTEYFEKNTTLLRLNVIYDFLRLWNINKVVKLLIYVYYILTDNKIAIAISNLYVFATIITVRKLLKGD